jgi:ABC-type multidrug transport system ATPase subunit
MYRDGHEHEGVRDERAVRVSVEHLLAGYGGTVALNITSLTLRASTVYGLVGANGAGKSTLLRTLSGLQRPIRGAVRVEETALYTDGISLSRHVGWMPDAPPLRANRTVRDTLRDELRGDSDETALEALAKQLGVASLLPVDCGRLSLGQRQRVALARMLLGNRPVLLLDEPTNGVDPEGREALAITLRERARKGATVVVSSHALRELEAFCDEFVWLERGAVSSAGRPSQLQQGDRVRVRARWIVGDGGLEAAAEAARRALASIDGVDVVSADLDALELAVADSPEKQGQALRALVHGAVSIVSFEPVRASIAAMFAQAAKERS